MKTYIITNKEKYGGYDECIFTKDDKIIIVKTCWKWMSFICNSEKKPKFRLDIKKRFCPYDQDDYDVEFKESWDGNYEFEYSDNCTEEDRSHEDEIREENEEILTEYGWEHSDDNSYIVGGIDIKEEE